jgi:ATP-dependent helicase/nuclease subunit A
MPMAELPADAAQRAAALDVARSVIVQAPAGSGKTDLLTRRFLRLLAVVDEPEDILAITFTRAATAEMRARIFADLESAAGRRRYGHGDEDRIALARRALAQSERRRWNLLNHPERLAVETIDSLSLRIAHDRPLLARLGGRLQPTEESAPLYALAARRTLDHLGGSDPALDEALAHLLDLRDNRLADCEALIAQMLSKRDEWEHAFPLSREMSEEDWDEARVRLERPFRHAIDRALAEAYRLIAEQPLLGNEILALANYAASNGFADVAGLAGIFVLSPAFSRGHWLGLCNLVLTKDGNWRKRVTVNEGFPPGKKGDRSAKDAKEKMEFLLARLRNMPDLLAALCAIRALPEPAYSDPQWTTLRHVFTVLRQAVAELRVVFAEQNAVDFTEVSLAALQVLRDAPDLTLARHLLIDEFQDTSRRQHDLIAALVCAWDPGSDPGDRRTVFLVGDPMQSIYMFRQAEVELFTHVWNHGLACADAHIPCDPVSLSVNFRSHAGVTAPLNEFFTAICAQQPPPGSAPGDFVAATANDPAPVRDRTYVHVHPQFIDGADPRPQREKSAEARRAEADEMVAILEQHLPAIERARAEHREYRVAVLVRSRSHLAHLIPLLRDRPEPIPFRAVELDPLSSRQELLDLRSLTRALLHPMDRIAWLAVLRAPWCGLTLTDLHRLTGSDDPDCKSLSVPALIERHQHLLSPNGQSRLARTAQILRRALDLRWRQSESPSFASWIERTWRTLGGPACLDSAARENTEVFFTLLDSVAPAGAELLTPAFDAQLDKLYAQPDPSVSEKCGIQLMTIHKAKGLGFDVVLVPGLDRKPRRDDRPLIAALERRDPFNSSQDEFLVAPLGAKGDGKDPLYQWVLAQRKLRSDEERKRLFYVACTRARLELHLLGTATVSADGLKSGDADSLLAAAWPALGPEFEARHARPAPAAAPHRVIAFPAPGVLEEIAAVADAAPATPPGPRRLPADYTSAPAPNVTVTGTNLIGQSAPEFHRPEGSRQARVIGSAVHALLERLGPALATLPEDRLHAHAASLLRASALTGDALASATAAVTNLLRVCAADPVCQWILAPHVGAASEASWSGFSASRLRTLRADRVFRAGPAPLTAGSHCLWIVDYKTGAAPASDPASWIAAERAVYAPQLLAYGRALRALHGAETPLRLGLYYPAVAILDFWDPDRL